LLTVLTTANQNNNNNRARRRQKNDYTGSCTLPPYKSLVLISCTNYGASAGIPGIERLLRQSRKQEHTIKVDNERQRCQNARNARNDWWLHDDNKDGFDDDDDDD
jgi:hypothetical protein